jgi:hypothetical protein
MDRSHIHFTRRKSKRHAVENRIGAIALSTRCDLPVYPIEMRVGGEGLSFAVARNWTGSIFNLARGMASGGHGAGVCRRSTARNADEFDSRFDSRTGNEAPPARHFGRHQGGLTAKRAHSPLT